MENYKSQTILSPHFLNIANTSEVLYMYQCTLSIRVYSRHTAVIWSFGGLQFGYLLIYFLCLGLQFVHFHSFLLLKTGTEIFALPVFSHVLLSLLTQL